MRQHIFYIFWYAASYVYVLYEWCDGDAAAAATTITTRRIPRAREQSRAPTQRTKARAPSRSPH